MKRYRYDYEFLVLRFVAVLFTALLYVERLLKQKNYVTVNAAARAIGPGLSLLLVLALQQCSQSGWVFSLGLEVGDWSSAITHHNFISRHVVLAYYLRAPPGGIAISHVCWCVCVFVCVFVS